MNVDLTVLHVPDCPNLDPLMTRLRQVTDLPVTVREISAEAEAVTAGMNGSPTLLINGIDPFVEPGRARAGVSCRLFRDQHGRLVPIPDASQLREAIAAGSDSATRSASTLPARPTPSPSVGDCSGHS